MAALQDFERGIEPNRSPGAEIADSHLAALEGWVAEHPGGGLLVAEQDEGLAGFILFAVREEFGTHVPEATRLLGQISDLWVTPDARGRGIARMLIAAAEAHLKSAGLKRIEITAVAGNERALRLYRVLGYDPHEVTLAKNI